MADTKPTDESFPEFKATPTSKRTIIGNMYDESGDENESEYSFVHPYGDKQCNVKQRTMLDRIAVNLKDVQTFGHAVKLHAEHKILKLIEEDYDSDSSNERVSKSKTINLIFDKATGCAANLRTVAGEIGEMNPCAVATTGGDSYERRRHRHRSKVPSPIKVVKPKKNASEVCSWSGDVEDDITVTSDEFYSDEDSLDGSESWSSSGSESSYETDRRSHTRSAKVRRKQQSVSRQALERAAIESDSDDEASFADDIRASNGKKLLVNPSRLHAQEMRPKPKRVNVANWEAFGGDFPIAAESKDDSSVTNIDIPGDASFGLRQFSWESKETSIVFSADQGCDFLTSSHIGPVVTKQHLGDALQLGDVIIRLDGEDVSTLEGHFVSELLMKFQGKHIRVTYLRKTMSA